MKEAIVRNAAVQLVVHVGAFLAMRALLTSWPVVLDREAYFSGALVTHALTTLRPALACALCVAIGVALLVRRAKWSDDELKALRIVTICVVVPLAWSTVLAPYNFYL